MNKKLKAPCIVIVKNPSDSLRFLIAVQAAFRLHKAMIDAINRRTCGSK